MKKFMRMLALITLVFTIRANAETPELYYMSIFGPQNIQPMPVFTVSCPDSKSPNNKTVKVDVYQFEDGVGTNFINSVIVNVITDDATQLILKTTDGKIPSLLIQVDRKRSFATAPFSYPASMTFNGGGFDISHDTQAVVRQLNPNYPELNEAVGAILSRFIRGKLGDCGMNHLRQL